MTWADHPSVAAKHRCSCCGGIRFPLRKGVSVCFRCDNVTDWPAVMLVGGKVQTYRPRGEA